MKLRRTLKFHSLRKGKVRMTWNKYNLYNLQNVQRKIPNFVRRTFFQQKWTAKAMTRAYHGEHIKEQKWTRMFDRRLRSVVDMNPVYMAHNDGAEQATGRGSGRDKVAPEDVTPWAQRGQQRKWRGQGGAKLGEAFPPMEEQKELEIEVQLKHEMKKLTNVQRDDDRTPYMNMAFAPIERRIDVAIFRALFASSTRQARNMVIHGKVKINGQPMNHATYLLNPGDMFQVDPDAVMHATGMPKKKPKPKPEDAATEEDGGRALKKWKKEQEWKKMRNNAKSEMKEAPTAEAAEAEGEAKDEAAAAAAAPEADEGSLEPAEADEGSSEPTDADAAAEIAPEHTSREFIKWRMKNLANQTRKILSYKRKEQKGLSAKAKQQLRVMLSQVKEVQSKLGRKDAKAEDAEQLISSINNSLAELDISEHGAKKDGPKPLGGRDGIAGAAGDEAGDLEDDDEDDGGLSEALFAENLSDADLDQLAEKHVDNWLDKHVGDEEEQNSEEYAAANKNGADNEMYDVSRGMLGQRQQDELASFLEDLKSNPVDDSKPYKTPWEPRPYMSPFAFIPRYLEVNQNICAAVYLRHPVARQGMAEIPSPFPPEVQELAFNWYLRRR